ETSRQAPPLLLRRRMGQGSLGRRWHLRFPYVRGSWRPVEIAGPRELQLRRFHGHRRRLGGRPERPRRKICEVVRPGHSSGYARKRKHEFNSRPTGPERPNRIAFLASIARFSATDGSVLRSVRQPFARASLTMRVQHRAPYSWPLPFE